MAKNQNQSDGADAVPMTGEAAVEKPLTESERAELERLRAGDVREKKIIEESQWRIAAGLDEKDARLCAIAQIENDERLAADAAKAAAAKAAAAGTVTKVAAMIALVIGLLFGLTWTTPNAQAREMQMIELVMKDRNDQKDAKVPDVMALVIERNAPVVNSQLAIADSRVMQTGGLRYGRLEACVTASPMFAVMDGPPLVVALLAAIVLGGLVIPGLDRFWKQRVKDTPRGSWLGRYRRLKGLKRCEVANIAEGTHAGGLITVKSAAAIATRFLFAKKGADDSHMIACTADTDIPIGIFQDEAAAAEDLVAVQLLGGPVRTVKVACGGTVAAGDFLQVDSNSKAKKLSTSTGTYYIVGQALYAGASGDTIEMAPCVPVQRVVP